MAPSSVVAESVDERALEIEEREARSVGRKERRQLREQVLVELLPRAFTRSRRVSGRNSEPRRRYGRFRRRAVLSR